MAFQNPTPDPSQHGRPKQPLSNQEKLSLPSIPNVYELHQHETGTPAFYQTILNVVWDTATGVSFLINKEGTQLLKQLDMFEWSVPYPRNYLIEMCRTLSAIKASTLSSYTTISNLPSLSGLPLSRNTVPRVGREQGVPQKIQLL